MRKIIIGETEITPIKWQRWSKDMTWDARDCWEFTVEMDVENAKKIFTDNMSWHLYVTDEISRESIIDLSEYCVAGPIIDTRDGYTTVKMGKPTSEELLSMIEEVL